MSQIISASIDLTKIDKSKIVEGKNGQKYYNVNITINDQEDQYKQIASISQSQSKEEREAKTPKVYLGNGKLIWSSETKSNQVNETISKVVVEDLPF